MSSHTDDVTLSNAETLTGRVKWFNNKAGYGFITVTDGERSGSDIFVHHSSVQVENEQYKYLVQGEYVCFGLAKTDSATHEWQAVNVCGINGGKLMCETRREFKLMRMSYRNVNGENQDVVDEASSTPVLEPRQKRAPRKTSDRSAPRVRGEGPRDEMNKDWKLVDKNPKDRSRVSRQTSTRE